MPDDDLCGTFMIAAEFDKGAATLAEVDTAAGVTPAATGLECASCLSNSVLTNNAIA